jgi:peptide/nickel transport system substrate-binding protein
MTRLDRRWLLTSGAAAAVLAGAGFGAGMLPKRGGLLRAALSGGSIDDSWDMRRPAGLFMSAAAHGAVFDTLTEIAPDGALRGELATGWEARDDAATWDIALRRDVSFHDGRDLRAADVAASLRLHDRPGTAGWGVTGKIRRIEEAGSHRLRIRLAAPNPGFPYQLADPHLVIYPAAGTLGAMRDGIGTGLYRVEDFMPGQRLLARRVARHWKDGSAGWFDEIALWSLPDPEDRAAALTGRRVDVTDGVAAPTGEAFAQHRMRGRQDGIPAMGGTATPFAPYSFAVHRRLAVPGVVGDLWPLDNARIAERWWMA